MLSTFKYRTFRNLYGMFIVPGVTETIQSPGYGLDDCGSIPGNMSEEGNFFSTPPRPDRLWGPPSLLSSEYLGVSSGA
jgi:hypothetical protein